jgi:hypothetical protein
MTEKNGLIENRALILRIRGYFYNTFTIERGSG